ncbi:SAM-dependent methyltransferase [Bacteroidota bacterium]
MQKGNIFMIPSTLGDSPVENVIPSYLSILILNIDFYIVENIRTTRRFLKKLNKEINIDNLEFFVLNKYTTDEEKSDFLLPAIQGNDLGIISEAGCPGVADPGADIIFQAHKQNIRVIPLAGPSSIIMALMASGFNGQNFAFSGYIPIKKDERTRRIKQLEKRSKTEKQSQIFMETPFRNIQMFDDICEACQPDTYLCVATDISLDTEEIKSQTIKQWKKNRPDINKRPSIFILHSI